jgi:WD40 repeat protein
MLTLSVCAAAILVVGLEMEGSLGSEQIDIGYELGHRARVVTVSMSANAHYVASVSADGLLIVWDAKRGDVLWTRPNVRTATIQTTKSRVVLVDYGSQAPPVSLSCIQCDLRSGKVLESWGSEFTDIDPVTFSVDGEYLAGTSSRYDGEVRRPVYVWDVGTGQLIHSHRAHWTRTTAISLGDHGRFVLLGCEDGMCLMLDNDQEFPPHYFSGHTKPIDYITLMSDGNALLAGSRDGVMCWDVSNTLVARTKHKGLRHGIAGSSPGEQLWFASAGERRIDVFQETAPSRLKAQLVDSVEFSCADDTIRGGVIATGSCGGSVALWDAWSGRKIRELGAKYGIPRCVIFTRDGSSVLAGYSANVALLWDTMRSRSPRLLTDIASGSNEVLSVSYSKKGNVLGIGHYLGEARGFLTMVQLWDADGRERTLKVPLSGVNMGPVQLSRDGAVLACGNGAWSVGLRKCLWSFNSTHADCVVSWCSLTVKDDFVLLAGTRIVSPGANVGFLARSEAATGQLCAYSESPSSGFASEWVRTFSLRDDGLEMIVRGEEGWAVLDVSTFDLKRVLKLPVGLGVDRVTYFHGDQVLLWCHTGTLVLYDLTTNAESLEFAGHNAPITCVDCWPRENRIVSGSLDKSVILWDSATGRQLSRLVADDGLSVPKKKGD